MLVQRPVGNGPEFTFVAGLKWAVGRFQQLRLQFRAVHLQIQTPRGERHLMVAVRKHNRLATTGVGNEPTKLSLGFRYGNRFHSVNLSQKVKKGH